jgi:WD40 repeat protein
VDPLRAEEVLDETLRAPVSERSTLLDRLCGSDSVLREEVSSLLGHLPDPENPENPTTAWHEPSLEGQVVGGCRIECLLGRGGTGRVFQAMQEWPPRPVAVKVLRPELLSESARRRFRRETRALARLDHPAIARILSAGVQRDQSGDLPFVIMELVEGARNIAQWWRDTPSSLLDRLELFARVCDGVHHGHVRGLVHRDIKPSNVLVGVDGQPKVIDFGVASMSDDQGMPVTLTRAVAGTPGYMAPEQFDGPNAVDLRTDVHALGLLLHECLAGQPVYAKEGLNMPAAAKLLVTQRPPLLGSSRPECRGDLETIVAHAVELDPAARYQSASELAADIRRFIAGHPIVARPTPPMERLRMLARRNPWAATGFGVAVASLVLGLFASVAFGLREREAAARAERALVQSERALWLSRLSEMSRAIESADAGVVGSLLVRLHDDTSWPMRLLRALADESLAVFHGTSHFETFSAMAGAISPDGTVLALAMDQPNGVTLLDSKSLRFLRSLEPGLAAWALTFTRPQQRLVVGHDRTLSVWERPWSGPPRDIRLPIKVGTGIACSPDGARVVVCGDGTACLVDLETGSVLAEAERFDGQTTRADWAPDGAFVAVSGATGTIRILDAATMQVRQVLTAPTLRVLAIAFDPTGRWLAAGGDMRVLRVFDMSSGQPTSRDLRMDFSIWGLDWNPDGRTLAVADRGSGVRLVDVPPDGGPLTLTGSFLGHRGEVWDIAWAPDAMGLYSIGQYEVHRWRARPLHKDRSIELGAPGLGLCRLPDGDLMAICADATLWRIRDRADATRPERVWHGGPFLATAVAGDPARDRWAWIDASGELLILDASQAQLVRVKSPPLQPFPNLMAFSPDGRFLAVTGKGKTDPMLIFDAKDGSLLDRISVPWAHGAAGLAWIDSNLLACGDFSGCHSYRPDASGHWIHVSTIPGSFASMRPIDAESAIAFDLSGTVTRRSLRDGSVLQAFTGLSDMGMYGAISPDGDLLAAVGTDRRLHVFDRNPGEQLLSLPGHAPGRVVTRVEFTGSGARLATLDNAGGLVLWNTESARDRADRPPRQ